jgi:hypothetical protein
MKAKIWFRSFNNLLFKKTNDIKDEDVKSEINKIEDCFKNDYLSNFILKYENLLLSKNSNQYFTTLGINFKNGKVDSIKFYAHIFEDINDDELKQFIPHANDYNKYLYLKSKDTAFTKKNVGTILELKFKSSSDNPTSGFFYMLQNTADTFKTLGFPENMPEKLKKECGSMGINFEYSKETELFKRYYYFSKESVKLYFEKKLGFPLLGNFMEYGVGNGISKLNNYAGDFPNFWDKDKNFGPNQHYIIRYLVEKYSLSIIGSGAYLNQNTKAIYFKDASPKTVELSNMLSNYSNIFRRIEPKYSDRKSIFT